MGDRIESGGVYEERLRSRPDHGRLVTVLPVIYNYKDRL